MYPALDPVRQTILLNAVSGRCSKSLFAGRNHNWRAGRGNPSILILSEAFLDMPHARQNNFPVG